MAAARQGIGAEWRPPRPNSRHWQRRDPQTGTHTKGDQAVAGKNAGTASAFNAVKGTPSTAERRYALSKCDSKKEQRPTGTDYLQAVLLATHKVQVEGFSEKAQEILNDPTATVPRAAWVDFVRQGLGTCTQGTTLETACADLEGEMRNLYCDNTTSHAVERARQVWVEIYTTTIHSIDGIYSCYSSYEIT